MFSYLFVELFQQAVKFSNFVTINPTSTDRQTRDNKVGFEKRDKNSKNLFYKSRITFFKEVFISFFMLEKMDFKKADKNNMFFVRYKSNYST